MRRLRLGAWAAEAPVFAATVPADRRLWSWTRGVVPGSLLVSYDVLRANPALLEGGLHRALHFRGPVIVDSGGFGAAIETDPLRVYRLQRSAGADLGIVLDRVAPPGAPPAWQRAGVRTTIANARRVVRANHHRLALEIVVQGGTPRQLEECGRAVGAFRTPFYGIPLSAEAKRRRYEAALARVLHARRHLPRASALHGLGCGSRTLTAILAWAGVRVFDSRAYYQRAIYGENIASVSMCALGRPRHKPACEACLARARPGRTLEGRTDHNLREMLRELTRIRCAMAEGAMEDYLARRVGPRRFAAIKALSQPDRNVR